MKNIQNKILIMSNNSGGLYGFRRELIQELIAQGYEVYASTPFDNNIDDLMQLGIHLIETKINRRGINPINDFKLILDYFKIIKKIRPSLIITYTIKPNLYGGSVARILKIPYAINITGLGTAFQNDNLLRKFVIAWYKFACKKVKVLFFENEGNKNLFLDFNIVDSDKCCVLHGAGVNLDNFMYRPYPIEKKNIKFLFIGRIMKEKGIDELLDAASKIKEVYPLVEFNIVGPMEDNYKDIINKYSKKNIIKYYGYQNNVKPFIEECHCFILPSYHEGMANTLLEAASMGRPLITSDIYGCKEAINNNGYLVKVQDKQDLYIQIKKFIELDYDEKCQMSFNSRKHMENIFDKKKVVNNTIKYLFS